MDMSNESRISKLRRIATYFLSKWIDWAAERAFPPQPPRIGVHDQYTAALRERAMLEWKRHQVQVTGAMLQAARTEADIVRVIRIYDPMLSSNELIKFATESPQARAGRKIAAHAKSAVLSPYTRPGKRMLQRRANAFARNARQLNKRRRTG